MRRLLTAIALAAALALAACGGDDDGSSPLEKALAYLPADSPFAIALDTDIEGDQYKAVDAITGRFPIEGTSVEELLRRELAGSGDVDFDKDVKPLLGNPFVVGASDVTAFLQSEESEEFVAALQVKDEDALERLVERSDATSTGEVAGAQKYESDGTSFAIDGDMVVLAGSEQFLDAALERADSDDQLDEETFEAALDGLPDRAVARVYANVQLLLESDPDTADAGKVKWLAALRTLGMTASAKDDELELQINLRTDPEGLTDADLPIAAGDEAPPVIERDGEIGLGVRDPAQIIEFSESAAQSINPSGFGDYQQAKRTLDARLDVDIDEDLIGQLTGDLAASVALDSDFGLRAELANPDKFEKALERVAPALPAFAEGAGAGEVALERPSKGNPFYALAQADGDALVFGVVDGALVVSTDPDRAGELATGDQTEVDGAQGALALQSDAQELVDALVEAYGEAFGLSGVEALGARLFTDPFEVLSGSLAASPDGLRGRLSLSFE